MKLVPTFCNVEPSILPETIDACFKNCKHLYITGVAGCGKTCIANVFAHQLNNVIWIDGIDVSAYEEHLQHLPTRDLITYYDSYVDLTHVFVVDNVCFDDVKELNIERRCLIICRDTPSSVNTINAPMMSIDHAKEYMIRHDVLAANIDAFIQCASVNNVCLQRDVFNICKYLFKNDNADVQKFMMTQKFQMLNRL